jgi:putative ABC transport system ATP-binding protein
VAIARAIVNRPSLLLCDEPTGNLDSRATEQLTDLLDSLHAQGSTLVVITHNPAVAARAQRQIRIFDGVLSEQGRSFGGDGEGQPSPGGQIGGSGASPAG